MKSGNIKKIRIGTRGSKLALIQTELVVKKLKEQYPELEYEINVIKTTGDKILDKPLLEFGGKGAFVSEFEEALVQNKIDLAVHSSKDMPMELEEGLIICGVLEREDPRDVLVSKKNQNRIKVVGTSSLRRQMQIKELLSDISCENLRGNITSRLNKLEAGQYDGIILAAAGLKRLGLDCSDTYNYRYFNAEEMIPAGGQGIIAIEGRKNCEIAELVRAVSDPKTFRVLELERRAMQLFNAGCNEAVGVLAEIKTDEVRIRLMKDMRGKIVKKDGTAKQEDGFLLLESLVNEILEGI